MTTNKNKELLRNIGRRLREAPELSAAEPLPREIELHLELLKKVELGADGQEESDDPESADTRVTAD